MGLFLHQFFVSLFFFLGRVLSCPDDQCRILAFPSTLFFVGERLLNHTIVNITVIDRDTCEHRCYLDHDCVSINFYFGINGAEKHNCELNNSTSKEYEKELVREANYVYHGTVNFCAQAPCKNYGTCQSGFTRRQYRCLCPFGFIGHNCERESFRAVFTNLDAVGRYGPITLGNHYTGQDHDGQVTLSSGIQQWTVPYTGEYRIQAIGAAGGYDTLQKSSQYRGRGAKMTGTFSLFKFEVIQILIGQEGGMNNESFSSGGGGGTFVVRKEANTPLIIAGGGGGVDMKNSRHAGCDANINSTGNPGDRPRSVGENGQGAQSDHNTKSGGGGGFYSEGRSGLNREGGKGFLQGGQGGGAISKYIVGGFGGGGGGGNGGGGGGGGYSGGSSGDDRWNSCGGGGGSFNVGKNQQNECCSNSEDHGHVTVTFL